MSINESVVDDYVSHDYEDFDEKREVFYPESTDDDDDDDEDVRY